MPGRTLQGSPAAYPQWRKYRSDHSKMKLSIISPTYNKSEKVNPLMAAIEVARWGIAVSISNRFNANTHSSH